MFHLEEEEQQAGDQTTDANTGVWLAIGGVPCILLASLFHGDEPTVIRQSGFKLMAMAFSEFQDNAQLQLAGSIERRLIRSTWDAECTRIERQRSGSRSSSDQVPGIVGGSYILLIGDIVKVSHQI